MMTEFNHRIDKLRSSVDKRIVSLTPPEVVDIVSGGKKLRSTLTMLIFEELAESPSLDQKIRAIDLACSVEIIHAITLAADDIIDQDEMRRGKPSLYTLKGFSLAFLEVLSGLSVPYDIVAPYGAEYVKAVSETQKSMCNGVVAEITKELPATVLYDAIISRKTGSLFALAARFGAMAAGADVKKFTKFGMQLGNTYQIQDDIMDLLDVMAGDKTADPITGTEFILLKCMQLDDLAKQLVADINSGKVAPEKAKSLLYKTGIVDTLVRRRDSEKVKTLEMIDNRVLKQFVEMAIPKNFL
jgi:geranylgeranyl pyrophosphate synthase